ncbi:MAG: hypothetical protein V4596_06445 [Bdellovibrionota bacterium]
MRTKLILLFLPAFIVHFFTIGVPIFVLANQATVPTSCSAIFNVGNADSAALTISKILSDLKLYQELTNFYHHKKPGMYALHDIVTLSSRLSDRERKDFIAHVRQMYDVTHRFDQSKLRDIALALFDPIMWERKLTSLARSGTSRQELYSFADLLLILNPKQKTMLKEIISENYALSTLNKINRDYELPSKRSYEAILRFLIDADKNFEANVMRHGVLKAYETYTEENQAVVHEAGFGNYRFSQILQTYKLFQDYLKAIPDTKAKVYFKGSFVSRRAKIDSSDLDLYFEGTNNFRFQRLVKIATGSTVRQGLHDIFHDHEKINLEIEDTANNFIDKGAGLFARYGEVGGILIEVTANDMRLLYFPKPSIKYVDPAYPEAVLAREPVVYQFVSDDPL